MHTYQYYKVAGEGTNTILREKNSKINSIILFKDLNQLKCQFGFKSWVVLGSECQESNLTTYEFILETHVECYLLANLLSDYMVLHPTRENSS
jgi:hypothetical protein